MAKLTTAEFIEAIKELSVFGGVIGVGLAALVSG